MTTRGIWKETHYWNTVEARRDWGIACTIARERGLEPPNIDVSTMGHRKIDGYITKLLAQCGLNCDDLLRRKEQDDAQ